MSFLCTFTDLLLLDLLLLMEILNSIITFERLKKELYNTEDFNGWINYLF